MNEAKAGQESGKWNLTSLYWKAVNSEPIPFELLVQVILNIAPTAGHPDIQPREVPYPYSNRFEMVNDGKCAAWASDYRTMSEFPDSF